MSHAVRATNSRIWHLTNNPGNRDGTHTMCNRTLSYPDMDRDGYHFDEMHTWPINQDPKQTWQLCPKCGTMADFMAASEERWYEAEARKQMEEAAKSEARRLAREKTAILGAMWDDTIKALESVGWQIGEPQYRRYTATMEVNGFSFKMEFVRPEHSFGVNLATGEVSEMGK